MSGLATVIGPDFHITGGPTEFKLTPLSLRAQNWCRDVLRHHITTGSYVINYRELDDVIQNLRHDNMTVQWEYGR